VSEQSAPGFRFVVDNEAVTHWRYYVRWVGTFPDYRSDCRVFRRSEDWIVERWNPRTRTWDAIDRRWLLDKLNAYDADARAENRPPIWGADIMLDDITEAEARALIG
jgi:hypothetical protein